MALFESAMVVLRNLMRKLMRKKKHNKARRTIRQLFTRSGTTIKAKAKLVNEPKRDVYSAKTMLLLK